MGFRIIVYNNIITKFYTFQAERERVLLKSCTILISTHNWGLEKEEEGGERGGCKYVCSDTGHSQAPDTIFQYLRQLTARSSQLLASSFNFNFQEISVLSVDNVYQFTKGPFSIYGLYILILWTPATIRLQGCADTYLYS